MFEGTGWVLWLGPVIGVMALITTIVIFFKNRRPKRLQYELVADQAMITPIPNQQWSDLSVKYKDETIEHPRLVTVCFVNTGKVEIPATDMDQPLAVHVGNGDVLKAATLVVIPEDRDSGEFIVQPAGQTDTAVVAEKLLLNVGDRLEFRLLLDGQNGHVEAKGRVAGLKLSKIGSTNLFRMRRPWMLVPAVIAVLALNVGIVITVSPLVNRYIGINAPSMPNVIGQNYDEAEASIKKAGIDHIVVINPGQLSSSAIADARVIDVRPYVGERVRDVAYVVVE